MYLCTGIKLRLSGPAKHTWPFGVKLFPPLLLPVTGQVQTEVLPNYQVRCNTGILSNVVCLKYRGVKMKGSKPSQNVCTGYLTFCLVSRQLQLPSRDISQPLHQSISFALGLQPSHYPKCIKHVPERNKFIAVTWLYIIYCDSNENKKMKGIGHSNNKYDEFINGTASLNLSFLLNSLLHA